MITFKLSNAEVKVLIDKDHNSNLTRFGTSFLCGSVFQKREFADYDELLIYLDNIMRWYFAEGVQWKLKK